MKKNKSNWPSCIVGHQNLEAADYMHGGRDEPVGSGLAFDSCSCCVCVGASISRLQNCLHRCSFPSVGNALHFLIRGHLLTLSRLPRLKSLRRLTGGGASQVWMKQEDLLLVHRHLTGLTLGYKSTTVTTKSNPVHILCVQF